MATLAEGVKESDAFLLTISEVGHIMHRFQGEDEWSIVKEALRERGVCVVDTSGNWIDMLLRLTNCRTCGEAVRVILCPLKETEQPHRNPWDEDMKAVKRAWEIEYVASEPVLDSVAKQLHDYSSCWSKYQRYAPLVVLVQSSGWGKSRLMCQLWRKGFYVFYISCMAEKQTGFPRRTEKLANIVQNRSSTEATFVALVLGILTVLNTHADGMTCQQWIEAQLQSSVLQEKVYDVYVEKLKKISQLGCYDAEEKFELAFKEETDKLAVHDKKLLLCVDEAGELGENFVKLRRSLRSIPRRSSFFSIVLGTDTKLADLALAVEEPTVEDDPSARVRLSTPYNVYHPLYLIGKSDIFAKDGTDICKTIMAPEDVIRHGRPLWAAYYDSVESANKLLETIHLAKVKLLGRNINTSEQAWVTQDIAVAVFSCIVGLDVVAWESLPQQFVAKHMGTIVKISKDRRRVYTAAAAEPVLAAAAAELLHAKNDAFLGDFLNQLIAVLLDGLVLEGIRGEVAIRIIIMLAMHECTKDQHYIQHVTLARFLETMFGKSVVDKLKENGCDLDGYLFFNSFTLISVEPFKQLVEEAFARCTALIAQRNESILEIAIPLCYADLGAACACPMQETVKREPEDQGMKGVVVSGWVKNRRNDKRMKSAIGRLQNDDRMSTPVQLFFQLGYSGGGQMLEVDYDTVICYGLDCFQHLKSQKMQDLNVLSKLKLLLRTCENPFKGVTSEERVILEDMIPFGLASKSFVDDMKEDDMSQPAKKWKQTKKMTPRRQDQTVEKGVAEDSQMGEPDTNEDN